MHRFKVSSPEDGFFLITGDELHHLLKVLRLKVGDAVAGFDNSGREWLAEIETVDAEFARCRITDEINPEVEARAEVYLVMGLAKGEKMEWVIQKGTELGMAGFIPLRTERAVLKLEGRKAEERVGRWRRIAAEAVKQCRRVSEPRILPVADWHDLPDLLTPKTQWLIPYENEKTVTLKKVLVDFDLRYPVAILIGPEGGFSEREAAAAVRELQAKVVSLGPRILRTETAALAALVMVLHYFGDLG